MSGDKNHFENVGENPPSKDIGGIGGSKLSLQGISIFIFCIQDDSSKTCTIQIPNSLYVLDLLLPLVCPQHWGQATGTEEALSWSTMEMSDFFGGVSIARQSSTIRQQRHLPCEQPLLPTIYYILPTVWLHCRSAIGIRCWWACSSTVPQVQDSDGAVADNKTIKVSNVKMWQHTNSSQPCPILPTGNQERGKCSLFQQVPTN